MEVGILSEGVLDYLDCARDVGFREGVDFYGHLGGVVWIWILLVVGQYLKL